jgi:hypothetical protein
MDFHIMKMYKDKESTKMKSANNRKLWKCNDPDLVQAFLKKWWVESDFKVPNLPLALRLKVSGCHYNSIYNTTWTKQVKQFSKQHQAQWSKWFGNFVITLIMHTVILSNLLLFWIYKTYFPLEVKQQTIIRVYYQSDNLTL